MRQEEKANDTGKSYCITLVYKPSLTKEQVEVHLHDKIVPIVRKIGFKTIKSVYCDSKLLCYPMKKYKNAHYACVAFIANGANKQSINNINKELNDIEDLLRVVVCATNDVEDFITTLTNFDTYAEEKLNELS